MNSRQLQYAVVLSEIRNFSQVAEKLNISQPALSKQILSLENELGLKLFDRSTTPLTLTPAGQHFIQEARDLLYKEEQLLRSMEQFKSGERGRLKIGISPFRSFTLMPPIIKKVKEKYPGVQIVLHEARSNQLKKDAAEGKFDFAIVNLPVDESALDIVPMERESLVLVVPNSMAKNIPCVQGTLYPEISFSDCRALPFIVIAHPQEMRKYFDQLCAQSDIVPNIAVEITGGVTTALSMAQAGLGAALLPMQFVKSQHFDDQVTLFVIKDKAFTRQPVIITKRRQYISEYAKYAIDLLQEPTSIE